MDQNPKEPTFEESFKEVMQTLPPAIRNYLAQGKYSVVASRLMAKYGLRVDQGGVLEREIMLLLMGVESSDDFVNSLKSEATLPEDTVFSIMTDINQEILVPLQEEMRKGEAGAPEPVRPAVPQGSPPVSPSRHMINKISMPPVTPRPVDNNEKLLEDHEEPSPSLQATEGAAHIEFAQAPTSPPRPMMPTPANLPGASRPSGDLSGGGVGIPPVPPKSYPSDPYREPIDEKE